MYSPTEGHSFIKKAFKCHTIINVQYQRKQIDKQTMNQTGNLVSLSLRNNLNNVLHLLLEIGRGL